jgi:hypothetical protein
MMLKILVEVAGFSLENPTTLFAHHIDSASCVELWRQSLIALPLRIAIFAAEQRFGPPSFASNLLELLATFSALNLNASVGCFPQVSAFLRAEEMLVALHGVAIFFGYGTANIAFDFMHWHNSLQKGK